MALSQQVLAQNEDEAFESSGNATPTTETSLPPQTVTPGPPPVSRWVPPQPEQAKEVNEKSSAPVRVRVGLRITPFKKVVTRQRDGTSSTRFVPAEPVRQTLRAQLNKTNHFFVGDYHVESVPVKWVRKSMRYELRLNVFRRYGAFGQLEESVGSVNISGVLQEQEANIHVLLGVGRQRMRDKFGNPVLDIVAGFTPGPSTAERAKAGPKVSQGASDAEQALIRGRF